MAKITSLLISETNSKNCSHLEIRLILSIGRLRETGDRYIPVSAALGDVRANEEISDVFFVSPFWKHKFMQQFHSHRDRRRDFVTCPERLAEFALALDQVISFPDRFESRVVCEDERPEIFLRDQFRFQFNQSIACSQLSVDRQPNWVIDWIGQIVD